MSTPPAPLAWHPWYRDKTWLMEWLEGRGPYSPNRVFVPVEPAFRLGAWVDDPEPLPKSGVHELVLTKSKAYGPAPYVGRPFIYTWPVGTDQYGRMIAGDAKVTYTVDEWEWAIQGGVA